MKYYLVLFFAKVGPRQGATAKSELEIDFWPSIMVSEGGIAVLGGLGGYATLGEVRMRAIINIRMASRLRAQTEYPVAPVAVK